MYFSAYASVSIVIWAYKYSFMSSAMYLYVLSNVHCLRISALLFNNTSAFICAYSSLLST